MLTNLMPVVPAALHAVPFDAPSVIRHIWQFVATHAMRLFTIYCCKTFASPNRIYSWENEF